MFRFDQGDGLGKSRLIDEERHVSFRVVGGRVMSSARPAILSWDGREIPLEFDSVERTDTASGEAYALYHFDTFGSSWTASSKTGTGAYAFRDPQERAHALHLATEAVLVFAFRYVQGDWDVDALRVLEEGHEWRASDFGYRTSTDIMGGTQ